MRGNAPASAAAYGWVGAPKTSLGSGTTTSSTFLESCFTSTCFGVSAARAEREAATRTVPASLENLANGIIGLFDC